jgi:allantoate deiminase
VQTAQREESNYGRDAIDGGTLSFYTERINRDQGGNRMEYGIDAVRIESMLTRLAKITATPGQGVTRLPFTPEMSRAAVLLEEWMTDAGLAVRQDASGAVIGTLRGERDRTVVIASHYDSVQYGGAYDGSAGVVCGIEIARAFAKRGKPLDTLAIVATNDEEGARFGSGFFSTKAFLGQHTDESLSAAKDACGISALQAMRQFGLSPERLPEAAWDLEKVAAFLEIHIEQSTALEQAGGRAGHCDRYRGHAAAHDYGVRTRRTRWNRSNARPL